MRHLTIAAALLLLCVAPARAQVPPESTGEVERLPMPPSPHWAWVADLILNRVSLIDIDGARFLGMVNGGYGTIMPLFPRSRTEFYLPATYYSRGTRGTRTDVFEFYDGETLAPVGEVVIPPKRATNAVALAHSALSDDEQFAAVFNWTTGTSLSIVDVVQRRFAGEISLPGCSLVYAAGPRRFFSICADGALFTVSLNADGSEAARSVSKPVFDPKRDPLTEKAVRSGDQWLFVSFAGLVHPIDVSGPELVAGEPWPLVPEAERGEDWRIGGLQHLAVHEASGRLYALMHRGGPDTHKEPGEEVWIYDIGTRRRLLRVPLVNPGLTVYGFPVAFGQSWPAPFNGLSDWLIDTFVPPAVGFIQVTQDESPLLLTASQFTGAIAAYDARTGAFVRRVMPTGWTSDILLAPYGRPARSGG